MMELVSIVAGVICGILAGAPTAILLIIWMSGFEERWNNRAGISQTDVQQNFQLWQADQGTARQFTIVERQMLEDGKQR